MQRIHAYWATFFGLTEADYLAARCHVVPHAHLKGYEGIWLFRREASVIISAPAQWVGYLEEFFPRDEDVPDDAQFLTLVKHNIKKVIGPAYQGFLEPANFRPTGQARLLIEGDNAQLCALEAACEVEQWEHSNLGETTEPVFGCFLGEVLVAAASYELWAPDVASPGLITHPDFRGRGLGSAVLSAVTAHGLEQSFLMAYQTLMSNQAAIAAAEKLGYQRYASHIAVRLRS